MINAARFRTHRGTALLTFAFGNVLGGRPDEQRPIWQRLRFAAGRHGYVFGTLYLVVASDADFLLVFAFRFAGFAGFLCGCAHMGAQKRGEEEAALAPATGCVNACVYVQSSSELESGEPPWPFGLGPRERRPFRMFSVFLSTSTMFLCCACCKCKTDEKLMKHRQNQKREKKKR